MYTLCFLVASVKLKVYKKSSNFHLNHKKYFGFQYLVLVDATDRSLLTYLYSLKKGEAIYKCFTVIFVCLEAIYVNLSLLSKNLALLTL